MSVANICQDMFAKVHPRRRCCSRSKKLERVEKIMRHCLKKKGLGAAILNKTTRKRELNN